MTGVRLHHSNRMEALAAALVHVMRADPGDPIAPERIVVPHPTIARWLSLELARGLGIAANVRFEQPAEFAWSLMRAVVPDLPRDQPYTPARLRWRILDLLPAPAGEAADATARSRHARGIPDASGSGGGYPAWEDAVRGYLRDGDSRKRLELADRLARVFDQCLLYRKDWILEWERGETPHWQSRLWRNLIEMDDLDSAVHWVRALGRFTEEFRTQHGAGRGAPRPDDALSTQLFEPSPHGDAAEVPPPGYREVRSQADEGGRRPPGWPRRASLFAVQALSPSYLELLREAAQGIDLHLFLLNPCREYWGDIHSRREIGHRSEGADPDTRYLTEGNELLAAWGRAGRDGFDALVEIPDAEWEEHFEEPTAAGRLAAVQRDVLDLRLAEEAAREDVLYGDASGEDSPSPETPPGPVGVTAPAPEERPLVADAHGADSPVPGTPPGSVEETAPAARKDPPAADAPGSSHPAAGTPPGVVAVTTPAVGSLDAPMRTPDDSLQIHVCHSPVREAEVLHDRLLAVFDAHPDLEPADVLVLTPDLEVYGPAVDAVFAAAGRIPCNVARARMAESRTLRAFLDLLALPGSRHAAESVLAPLAAPAVRTRFGIGESDVAAIRDWVREAGIRWGVDEAHRGEEGLPETSGHTWRHGLRRLLLGYAVADGSEPIAGLVPCRAGADGFDGDEVDGELLGRFASYCEKAFELRARLGGRRRPARWGAALRDVVRDFFADGSEPTRPGAGAGGSGGRALARELADETATVRALVRDFEIETANAEAPVPVEVVLDVLRERTDARAHETARLADGATVASLGLGRVFPAGVVCVAGMNDGVFPRLPSAPSFDVIAAGRARRGDRDVRYDDRFAFLEALLAARRCFIVTYAGRGLRDDTPIPPSVLVDELKDYLRRRFPGVPVETRHPLQPFSPRYFETGDPQVRGDTSIGAGAGPAPVTTAEPPGESEAAELQAGEPEAGDAKIGVSEVVAATVTSTVPAGKPQAGESGLADAKIGAPEVGETQAGGSEVGDAKAGRTEAGETGARGTGTGEGLFSYSRGMCEAAKIVRQGATRRASPPRFTGVELPEPDESRRCVDLSELVAFYANPTKFLLRDRLGVRLELDDLALEDEEPFELDNLERYHLRADIWDQMTSGIDPERGAALLHGSGRLPQEGLGRFVEAQAREEVEPLEGVLAPYRSALDAEPRAVDFELDGFRVLGAIEHVDPAGVQSSPTEEGEAEPARMVWWRIGNLRARDRIAIRLRQLAWTAAGHGPLSTVAMWRERGEWKSATFPAPENAREELGRWLLARWQGLAAPLAVFPETSMAFAKAMARAPDIGDGVLEAAREKARTAWLGDDWLGRGEVLDPYRALVYDEHDPLTDAFEALAATLLVPLVESQP